MSAARPDYLADSVRPEVPGRWAWVWVTAIAVLGAALRVYGLARRGLWYDEGSTMLVVNLVSTPSRLFDSDWQTEPPLVPVLVWVWLHVLRALGADLSPGAYHTDFLIRLVPCAFSIGAIPLGFAVARRITGSVPAGVVASLLLAIAPLQVFYAQELRPYASMMVFVLAALWSLVRALESDTAGHWAGFTLSLAASMYNHFFTVWYIASLGLAVCIVFAARRRVSAKWVVSQAALFVLILPAIQQGLAINGVISQMTTSWYPPLRPATGLITITTFFAGYSPRAWAYYTLFALGMALAAYGAWTLRRRGAATVVAFVVAVVPIAGNLLVWSMRAFSYYEHRLFIVCGFLFFVFVAAGTVSLRSKALRAAVLAVWVGCTAPCLLDYYAQRIHPSVDHRLGMRHKPGNRDVAARVRESMKPGDVAGHFSHFTFFPMQEHYLPDVPQVTLGLTGEDRKNMIASYPHEVLWERSGALPVRIDVVAARHDRMWYIESWWEPFDPPPWNVYYRAWLQRHGVIGPDEQFDGVGLTLFDFATMRAAPVRIEQFADAGHVSAAGYIDARGAVVGSPARADWDVHDGFVLRRDPANGNITIMNLSETPRTYRWRYLACAEAIEPLSFNRAEPETDVWRPVIHGDPAFFDDLDPIKMAAALERGGNEVGTLYADVVLPRGTYAMYAYVWNEVGAANASRASLRFRMGNSTANTVDTQSAAIGAVTPWRAQGESGWAWQEIATVESDGARRRLEITAALPDGLERAHADIGRVVFVADGMDANTILAPTTNHVSVAAGGTATISVQPGETAVGRRDVFVEEAETREVRYVNWYVAGP